MEKLTKYRQLIKQSILKHAADSEGSGEEESETQVIFDDERGHYYLMDIGWDEMRRIHTCLLHLDLKNSKVWIQRDFVEAGIASELMEKGIPKKDIVLGFQAPFKRPYTEFAVA